jgi:hypothetical protein
MSWLGELTCCSVFNSGSGNSGGPPARSPFG